MDIFSFNPSYYNTTFEKILNNSEQATIFTPNTDMIYKASNDDVLSLLANDNYGETTHDIKMERTFISGGYDVICLPFVISREEQLPEALIDAEIRKLYSVTKTIDNSGKSMAVLNFIKIDSPLDMQPGVPYLVKTEQDINTEYILFNQLTQADILVGEPLFEAVDGVVFQGVYNPTTLPQGAYVIGEDNQLTTTYGTIKGYRGYFMIDDPELSNLAADGRVSVSYKESLPTELQSASIVVPQVQKILQEGCIYILRNGQVYSIIGSMVK